MRDTEGIIRALNARTRREILALVWDRELSVGEIAAAFELTAPTISQHLSVLRDNGLVEMRASGNSRFYRACPEALEGLHGALEGTEKWRPATDIPEAELAEVGTALAVIAAVEVDVSQEQSFRAFTSAEIYSAWMGVPVRIEGEKFSATLEWGTEVRGRYVLVAPPELIVMVWDFDDDIIPVPGQEMTGYLRVQSLGERRSRVQVHQLVETPMRAEFMKVAWGLVLGRFKQGVAAAFAPDRSRGYRRPRRKL